MTLTIKDHQWYKNLIEKENGKGLLSRYPLVSLFGKLLISRHYFYGVEDKRVYTFFNKIPDFIRYQEKFPVNERWFYEVISGSFPQKPHFDIDIEGDDVATSDRICQSVIDSIILVLKENGTVVDLNKHILVFTSHSKPGSTGNKRSYHIILRSFCHRNNVDAKGFYDEVVKRIPKEYVKYVDNKVYSNSQQFRLVGSQKPGTDRIKVLSTTFNQPHFYEETQSEKHMAYMLLDMSLVSNTKDCVFLPNFEPEKHDTIGGYSESLSDPQVKMCINFVTGFFGNDSPFRYRGVGESLIAFDRLRPSHCTVCNRVHENENPYARITKNGSVYFCCGRTSTGIFLGSINEGSVPNVLVQQELASSLVLERNIQDKLNQLTLKPKEITDKSEKEKKLVSFQDINVDWKLTKVDNEGGSYFLRILDRMDS